MDSFKKKVDKLLEMMHQEIISLDELLDMVKRISRDVIDSETELASEGLTFDLVYKDNKLGYAVSQGSCEDDYVYIPDNYKGLPVIWISQYGFTEQFSDYEEIRLPRNLLCIEQGAFSDCYQLKMISLPYGLEEIGEEAFSGCRSLSYITIPETVKYIGDYAFSDCASLWGIEFPGATKTISSYILSSSSKIRRVVIGEGTTRIEMSAFYECVGLEEIKIPKTVRKIETDAFSMCGNLKKIRYLSTCDDWMRIDKENNWNRDMPSCLLECIDVTVLLGGGEEYSGTNKQIEAFLRLNPPKVIKDQLILNYLENLDDEED